MTRDRSVRRAVPRRTTVLWSAPLLAVATILLGIEVSDQVYEKPHTSMMPFADVADDLRPALRQVQDSPRGHVVDGGAGLSHEYRQAAFGPPQDRQRLSDLRSDRWEPGALEPLAAETDSWLQITRPLLINPAESAAALNVSRRHLDSAFTALEDLDPEVIASQQQTWDNHRLVAGTVGSAIMLIVTLAVVVTLRTRRQIESLLSLTVEPSRVAVVRDGGGAVSVRATPGMDVTEVVDAAPAVNEYAADGWHLAEQRQQLIEQLQDLDRQKSEFFSTTNHELRSPLTAISGYTEMLLDGEYGEFSERQRQVLMILQRNTRRLQLLIEDVLLLDRLDKGRLLENCEMLDLGECVEQVLLSMAPQAARAQVRVSANTAGPWPVIGDRERLERAIDNIVNNAVKFTPPGGKVDLTMVAGADGDTVEFHCTDTGMGIPAQELGRLFTRFARASNATEGQVPGTGLGLVIVRTIVEQHGGRVALSSAEGEGSHVMLALPLAPVKPPSHVPV